VRDDLTRLGIQHQPVMAAMREVEHIEQQAGEFI
jgi:hypothetical protein